MLTLTLTLKLGDPVVSELLDIDAEVDGAMLDVIIDDIADVTLELELELELGLWDTAVVGEPLVLGLEDVVADTLVL